MGKLRGFIEFDRTDESYVPVAKRIKNYLIDIGGEIKSNGMNIMNNTPWTVAINNPDLSSKDKFYKIIN